MKERDSKSSSFNKAVLFLVFNRLEKTKRVFEEIKKAKPPRLYIGSDGGRVNREGEAEKVKSVRDYVMSNIDWECDVKTLFRKTNLGCKHAVQGAIDWFFENEEMGIILEDDCLPNQSFFGFCQENLDRYRDDQRIFSITGRNSEVKTTSKEDSYFFSGFISVWGWASWRRSWEAHKNILKNFDPIINKPLVTLSISHKYADKIIIDNAIRASKGEVDTWDYQWVLSHYLNNGLVITPRVNLIKNIGFDIDATHTRPSFYYERMNIKASEIKFPLVHPLHKVPNSEYDNFIFSSVLQWRSRFQKVLDFKFLKRKIINMISPRN